MSRGNMTYEQVLDLPLPLFIHLPRFLDPTGLISVLKNVKVEDMKKPKSNKNSLVPDMSTPDGRAQYESMLDEAIARGVNG